MGVLSIIKMNKKHLGLILDSGLSFAKHLNEKIKKAKNILGIIKHLSKYLPFKTLNLMYKAFVHPHLDYCDIHIPHAIFFKPVICWCFTKPFNGTN